MGKSITLNHITKIEGHAKLNLGIEDGKITTCELSSVEGSRYFEGIVIGRGYVEASEITSRICGICSCAHVIASITAIERAIGYTPTEQTLELRKLLTLGERIRSHATHLYFLALPDYLGYESAIAMAPKFKPQLEIALRLMKVGNKMIKVLASRDLHPVSATVGGWLALPTQKELLELASDLENVKDAASKTCELFFGLNYPDFKTDAEWFSLVDPAQYAMLSGVFKSAKAEFTQDRYLDFIHEYHEPRSSANFVVKDDHRYFVGAIARFNNNAQYLSPNAKKAFKVAAKKAKLSLPCRNPYLQNVAQAIEIVHAIDHAIEICTTLKIHDEAVSKINVRPGRGVGAIEVPRGTLWHDYTVDEHGKITHANIITPTAQNLLTMQEDIRLFVPTILNKSKEEIVLQVEKLIRSYDPCFSCSAHFLEVNWV